MKLEYLIIGAAILIYLKNHNAGVSLPPQYVATPTPLTPAPLTPVTDTYELSPYVDFGRGGVGGVNDLTGYLNALY